MYIFDIHSHILPGLDDGAKDQAESLRMLRMAQEQGIRKIIATPHWSRRYQCYSPDEVKEKCCELERCARERKIVDSGFHIYAGQEFFYSEEMADKHRNGKVLCLADSRFVLVEFFPGISWSALSRGIRELSMLSYQPIVAHMERYSALREADRVEELIEAGALMQMNYGSVDGAWYEKDSRWCRKMLKSGNVHFMGTDMHNTTSRSPRIKETLRWMRGHLDQDYVEDICCRNAERIVTNQRI